MRNNNTENSPAMNENQNINNAALEYMEQKYGEKFEYFAPYGDSFTGTREFVARCDNLPGQDVLVQIENYKHDDRIFRDNYIAVKYRQETIDFIKDCAVEQFGEAEVFYDVARDGQSPELSANASFVEFLSDTRVSLNFSIRTKASLFTSEEQAVQLAESLAVHGTHYITVLASVADDQYGVSSNNMSNSELQFVWRVQLTRLSDNIEIDWLRKV